MWSSLTFLAMVFIAVSLLAYVILHLCLPTALEKRLSSLFTTVTPPVNTAQTQPLAQTVQKWIEPLAHASIHAETWLTSPLRQRFSHAGLNKPNVVALYFASQIFLTLCLPALAWSLLHWTMPSMDMMMAVLMLLCCAALGYLLPSMALSRLITLRQRELFAAFPDAIDLLRVCVEAGLGLDAAIERVGREIEIESEALSQELSLLGFELRAGSVRADALRNLALRIGLEDIDALVSMLIQADRFGTSVADSLKVHAASLRAKRRLAAEIAAARLPVKILMPLIFCIFPALLTVLLGPAVINITKILLPKLSAPSS